MDKEFVKFIVVLVFILIVFTVTLMVLYEINLTWDESFISI